MTDQTPEQSDSDRCMDCGLYEDFHTHDCPRAGLRYELNVKVIVAATTLDEAYRFGRDLADVLRQTAGVIKVKPDHYPQCRS